MYADIALNKLEEDLLGRAKFATEIANGLVNSFEDVSESIVIGINGSWGTGKSTLINFIIKEVERISEEKNKEILVLQFNPWMFTGQRELQNIFLKELYLKFQSREGILKNASEKIANILGYLSWLKYVHTGAGEVIKDSKNILNEFSKEKDLSELKKQVDKLLIDSKIKLYISIDDIDRLTPSEITDIFQLVKLNGNFANTIFILAYDIDVVTNALEQRYGGNSKKYIEKIVQIDYSLPNVSLEIIKQIFLDSLEKLFSDKKIINVIKENIDKIESESFIQLFSSIRDVYRFNNCIKLRLPSIYEELNIIDFLCVESLRLFKPEAYNNILSNKENLIKKEPQNIIYANQGTLDNESISKFIDNLEFDDITKSIIKNLFVVEKLGYYNINTSDNLIREKRIANPIYFERYFNLQLGNIDISEKILEEFISHSSVERKINIFKELKTNEKDKLFRFLNLTDIKSQSLNADKLESIILGCLNYLSEVKYTSELIDFNSDFNQLLRYCTIMLEKLPNYEKKRKTLNEYIKQSNKKTINFSLIYICNCVLNAKKRLDKNELKSNYMWYGLFSLKKEIDDKYEKEILTIYKKNIKSFYIEVKINPEKLNGEELYFVLMELYRLHSDFYKSEFPEYIKESSNLLNVLIQCINRRFRSLGENIAYCLVKDQLLPCMDVDEIKIRLEQIDKSNLNEEQIFTVGLFLKCYSDNFKGQRFYKYNTLEELKI